MQKRLQFATLFSMDYSETIQFLYSLQMFGANLGLERVRKLAGLAGNPEKKLRFIHVAGTNGKGSTCAMLESIYRAAGLRVGLFTSPHLVSFRERMQINRQLVPENEIVRLVTEIQPWLKQFSADDHPTMFEVVTVMALRYFADQKCDLVIWETGLGGRLDATNIVIPLASLITNIALDHTQWLGDTLAKIAAEKAGVIKAGIPVVTAVEALEALAVIEHVAEQKNAPLTRVQHPVSSIQHPASSLLGDHQKTNAALALATVEVLQQQIPVSMEQIRAGLLNVNWPGRLQLVKQGGQKILLDGAHNVAGAEALRAALRQLPALGAEGGQITLIIGVLGDKDWREMCNILAPVAAKIFAVPVASARTADANELARFFQSVNPAAEVVACENFARALAVSKDEPLIVIAGSLYLIGEALEVLGLSPASAGERGLNEWTAKR
ncbi:MAG TPA: folylpolyglutamate synthase/dihydrofolate synthase family protein [Verrucomicrobiae bacterium]